MEKEQQTVACVCFRQGRAEPAERACCARVAMPEDREEEGEEEEEEEEEEEGACEKD
jgi:hypothetical protein